ncbi:MAG: flavodoxin domain-containing protein [Acidimicrobiia bacterium]|nr:flavodoxin domain-containing protein [Acidimicrobiia bacterium]
MADTTHVLVSASSKHGATEEIADAIASELASAGRLVTRLSPDAVETLEPYDAVVFGSAVYAGRWQKEARSFVERFRFELRSRPVWLFSSGPIGEPPMPDIEPADVADLVERTAAVDHRVFAGSLEQSKLGFGERTMVAALRAEYGDFRDWEDIRTWARLIAAELGMVDA